MPTITTINHQVSSMKYTRTGVILFTENYDQCVEFYSQTLELPVMYSLDNEHSKLTCCDMGSGNYLMIETEGTAEPAGKSIENNPVWFRFNVENVEETAEALRKKGIKITVRTEVWGSLADFRDPDGNYCSLRDEASFMQ